MRNKYIFVALLLCFITLVGLGGTVIYVHNLSSESELAGEERLIVTSFYPMYVATANIIGDVEGITLQNLSEPQTGCLHDFQLTPRDMKLLSTADLFVVNGGGIESFLGEVAKSYPELGIVDACDGLSILEDNAHAWMSVAIYRKQVENITAQLSAAMPSYADIFTENRNIYDTKLEKLQREQEEVLEYVKEQPVILFHEAYEYVAEDYDAQVEFVMDLDEERQVSAGEVAKVLAVIKKKRVPVIFAEELYGKDIAETIQKDSDVQVVYLNTLNRGDYDRNSYLEGMEENIRLIRSAFAE